MKKPTKFFGALIILISVKNSFNYNSEETKVNNATLSNGYVPHKIRHHHGSSPYSLRLKGFYKRLEENPKFAVRCKRYSEYYQWYYPPRTVCRYTYCNVCPTSTCRRRCSSTPTSNSPSPTIRRPTSAITPPYRQTTATSRVPSKNTLYPSSNQFSPSGTRPSTFATRKPCDCYPLGSQLQTCEVTTGICKCKPNYAGRRCNTCKSNHWMSPSGHCLSCGCNRFGSINSACVADGICSCKEGVGGKQCNTCLPNYYGSIKTKCKKCDPCDKEGHICSQEDGRCVCPPLTKGDKCDSCMPHSWGYEPGIGCKACNCSKTGSSNPNCDKIDGRCTCKIGFEGEKCDRCSYGSFGYPNCESCQCNSKGTVRNSTKDDFTCSDDGKCVCKENVVGFKCNQCKKSTFGLSERNPEGCLRCFCFDRSSICEAAPFKWVKIRSDDLTRCHSRDCWKVPKTFLGDLTKSYGGYMSVDPTHPFKVLIRGNNMEISSYESRPEIQLTETKWDLLSQDINCDRPLTRECFLVILQNVVDITIQPLSNDLTFNGVVLDVGEEGFNKDSTIEKCNCPTEYTGLSCQDPSKGYFRDFNNPPNWIARKIGKATKCFCNNRSTDCDPNTGYCKNCSDNTTGKECELCTTGFYKNLSGNCSPCLCPSEHRNNAQSCTPHKNDYQCNCKEGYTGSRCEECEIGYFERNTQCIPCNCNKFGSTNVQCNSFGVCTCRKGFAGNKCTECTKHRYYINNGVCTPCEECSMILFRDIDQLTMDLNKSLDLFEGGLNPPWKQINTTLNKYNLLSHKFNTKLDQALHIIDTEIAEDVLEKLRNKFHTNYNVSVIDTTNILYKDSQKISKDVDQLQTELSDIIKTIDNTSREHTSIKEALATAVKKLKEIEETTKFFDKNYNEDTDMCLRLSEKVDKVYSLNSSYDSTKALFKNLTKQLDHLQKVNRHVQEKSKWLESKNKNNNERVQYLKNNITEINQMEAKIKNDVSTTLEKFKEIANISDSLTELSEDLLDFDTDIFQELEDKGEADVNLNKILDHIENLEREVEENQRIFKYNDKDLKKINASGAFKTIVNRIMTAKKDAYETRELLNKLNDKISPTGTDSIKTKSLLSLAQSDRLLKRISNLKPNTRIQLTSSKVDVTKDKLYEYGKSNNKLTQNIQNFKKTTIDWASIIKNITDTEPIRKIQNQVNTLNLTSQYDLHKNFDKFLQLTSEQERNRLLKSHEDIAEKLKTIDLSYVDKLTILNRTRNMMDTTRINSIRNKINDIKNSIQYAKQAANEVNAAMELNNCLRKYIISNSAGSWRNLIIRFKCSTCNLFKTKTNNKTVSLTINNGKVHFIIDDVSMMSIQTKDNAEKVVDIQFEPSAITMEVSGVRKHEKISEEHSFGTPHFILIGSTEYKQDGYISSLSLNDDKIGLWNFEKTSGNCSGTASSETITVKGDNYYFIKDAYKKYEKSTLDVKELTMSFTFATFDENSLIYLAQDTTNLSSFIALQLQDGYVKLDIRHIDGTKVSLISDDKYNNGYNNTANIALFYNGTFELYQVKINDKSKNIALPLQARNVFKIKKSVQYIGGVDPLFKRNEIKFELPYSFKGYLMHSLGPTNMIMENGVSNFHTLEYKNAWFNGQGCLKIQRPIKSLKKLKFKLRPLNLTGAVMNINGFGFIYLNHAHIEITTKENSFVSSGIIAQDDYNLVEINKTHLTVNNEFIKITDFKIHDDLVITMGCHGNYPYFNGGISDIFVNDKPFPFNKTTIKEHHKVEIGKEKPFKHANQLKMLITSETNTMQNTEGCAPVSHYHTDKDAVKFGDKPNSFIHIDHPFWRHNYKFKFEFRTFYPNGLILISVPSQRNHNLNFLELQKGRIQLYVKNRKRKQLFSDAVNNGIWHTLEITKVGKRKQKLTVVLDGNRQKTVNIPRNTIRGDVYLGGVPSDFHNYADLKNSLHPFRGCMKSLKINEVQQQIVKNKNIGQCFPNVEEGAYFGGDAYAVYKRNFKVNNILELTFQFRTPEQNGILLSVSNIKNSPALSVELQNGAVVMTVDMGNGGVSKVTNNLDSEFALCNNKWHNVTALYSNSELTVKIDGIIKTWVQSDLNSLMDEIDAPLYIGGLPDNAPVGTLKTRENFKGCIRNLKVENMVMDWTDMQELNNILLNSCPIS